MRVLVFALASLLALSPVGVAVPAKRSAGLLAYVREDTSPHKRINDGVDLWVVGADGAAPRRLVGTRGWEEEPDWSPDGRLLAYGRSVYDESDPDVLVAWDVWTIAAGGRGRRNVSRSGGSSPAWSPDGRRIAFLRGDGLFVVRRDGTRSMRLVRVDDPVALAWSPSGGRIAFAAPDQLGVVRSNGGGRRLLARGASSENTVSWSPDGRRIAYSGIRRGESAVFLANAATGRRKLLGHGYGDAVWSPDGRWIALVRGGSARQGGIFLASPSGGKPRRLTRGFDLGPTWSPDGRKLAFRRGLVADIYVVDVATRRVRNLTRTPRFDEREPDWRPG